MPDLRLGRPIEVQMIADLACPWCYIGLRRLERARAMRPQVEVAFRWWPFLLNPHLPEDGMEREAYLRMKFGSAAAAQRIYARVAEAGREAGIDFAFERVARTPNTVAAQLLLLAAQDGGHGEAAIEALFRALFLHGQDIGEPGVLETLAAEYAPDLTMAALTARAADDNAVLEGHRQAERLGVRGVPVFVVDRQHAISGAQPPEVLAGLLDLAAATPIDAGSD